MLNSLISTIVCLGIVVPDDLMTGKKTFPLPQRGILPTAAEALPVPGHMELISLPTIQAFNSKD